MSGLTHLRCFNHANREAAARCPRCGRTFCRECITEHEGRAICAPCLAALTQGPKKRRSRLGLALGTAWCFLSVLFLWSVFYYLGKILLTIPSSFHESILPKTF